MGGEHGSGGSTETAHHHDSPLATYLTHVFAGTFLGLLVAVVMAMLHNISPFPALERAGADAAQRMFAYTARDEPGRPTVVLIGLDRAEIDEIVAKQGEVALERRLRRILAAGPARLLIDLQVPEDAPDEREDALEAALDRVARDYPTIPVVLSMPWRTAAEGHVAGGPAELPSIAPNLILGASLFEPDADSVVRQVRASLCSAHPSGRWVALPHLAAPHVTHGTPARPSLDAEACEASPEIPILFHAGPEVLVPGSIVQGPMRYVPPGSDASADTLAGATVVLGAVGSASLAGRVRTPLGVMDSALVAANAALTLANADYVAKAGGHGPAWVPLLLWAIGALVVFVVAVPAAAVSHTRRVASIAFAIAVPPLLAWLITIATGHPPDYPALLVKLGAVLIAAAIFSLHSLAALMRPPLRLPRALWRFVTFLLAAAGAVLGVLMFNLFLAEWLLPLGWRIGSLLPAFAVMLEAVAEGLKPVSGAIHQAVERRIAPRARPALMLPLLVLPPTAFALGSARAAGGEGDHCAAPQGARRISVDAVSGQAVVPPDAVRISRHGGDPVALGACRQVRPGDVLLLNHGVGVRVPYASAKPDVGPLILIVQPMPVSGPPGAFERFRAAVGEAVLPPTISPRLPVQAALSLPVGKKTPPPPSP